MKATKIIDSVKEYTKKLSDADLRYLTDKLSLRVGSDVSDAVGFLEKSQDIKTWFGMAKNAEDFFDMIDQVENFLNNEHNKRFKDYDTKFRV